MTLEWGIYSVGINALELITLMGLLYFSRRWTSPSLERRVSILEGDQHQTREKLALIDRDLNALVRSGGDAEEHLARELDAIKEMLQGKVSIRRQFEVMAEEMADLKTTVQALPCITGNAIPPACPDDTKG